MVEYAHPLEWLVTFTLCVVGIAALCLMGGAVR